MDIALWIVTAILALKLLTVTWNHGLHRRGEEMESAMARTGLLARPLLAASASSAFLTALGLLAPLLPGAPAWIAIAAASVAGYLQLGAIFIHRRSRDKPRLYVSLVLLLFALFIGVGRWALAY